MFVVAIKIKSLDMFDDREETSFKYREDGSIVAYETFGQAIEFAKLLVDELREGFKRNAIELPEDIVKNKYYKVGETYNYDVLISIIEVRV